LCLNDQIEELNPNNENDSCSDEKDENQESDEEQNIFVELMDLKKAKEDNDGDDTKNMMIWMTRNKWMMKSQLMIRMMGEK
jgi:hypothetical protein